MTNDLKVIIVLINTLSITVNVGHNELTIAIADTLQPCTREVISTLKPCFFQHGNQGSTHSLITAIHPDE